MRTFPLRKCILERLWRSIKYEEVYLKAYQSVAETRDGKLWAIQVKGYDPESEPPFCNSSKS